MYQEAINHLWQSSLFLVGVVLLSFLLRHDGARIRYWLWWSASLKFLVPFAFLTMLGRALAGDVAPVSMPETWSAAAGQIAQPFVPGEPSADWSWLLVAAWAAGAMVVIARRAAGALRLGALLRRADFGAHPVLNGRRWIGVYHTDERVEPGVVGLFSPVILLPSGLDRHLTTAQLEAVIAHELCHIRSRDNLTAIVHMLVEAVFWFFPPVWWIGARLIDERERACDEQVVALGHDRETYAEGVLNVCEHYLSTPIACAAGVSGGALARRITEIMRRRAMRLRLIKKMMLAVVAAGTFVVPVLVGLTSEGAAFAQRPVPPGVPGPDEPIVKVAPIYPPRAALRGLEGFVVLEFTVASNGSTSDIEVVESSSTLFQQRAIDAVAKWKYRAPVEDDVAVARPGVRATIRFEIPGPDGGRSCVPVSEQSCAADVVVFPSAEE